MAKRHYRRYSRPGRRSAEGSTPPDIGWHDFYWADSFALDDNTTPGPWVPTHGTGAGTLAVAGTPKYRTGQAKWGGRGYMTFPTAATDGFYSGTGNLTQPFVTVVGVLATGAPSGTNGKIMDGYDGGGVPGNRVFLDYQDTTIDQLRTSGGTTLSTGWSAAVGFNTVRLLEVTYDGASSDFSVDGSSVKSGAAGANSLDGLVIGILYDLSDKGFDTGQIAFLARIIPAALAAGRSSFLGWYNDYYNQASA